MHRRIRQAVFYSSETMRRILSSARFSYFEIVLWLKSSFNAVSACPKSHMRCAVDKNIVVIVGLAVQLLPGAVNDSIAPNPDLTVIRGQGAAFLYQQAGIAGHNMGSHCGIVCDIDLRHSLDERNGCLTGIHIGNREFGRSPLLS